MKNNDLTSNSQKIVIVWGTFDRLHTGHKEFLLKANQYGKLFIIVIPSHIKHKNSGYCPIKNEYQRRQEILEYATQNKNINIENIVIDYYENGLKSLQSIKTKRVCLCLGFDQYNAYDSLLFQFLKNRNKDVELIRLSENGNGIHSHDLRQQYLEKF